MILFWCRHWLKRKPQGSKPSRRGQPVRRAWEGHYVPALEFLESRNLLSFVSWDAQHNPDGGSWEAAGSWLDEQEMHRVPMRTDDVVIGNKRSLPSPTLTRLRGPRRHRFRKCA